jgi:UDP-N-acetylmuramyl pentapeptide phosphotransferase/UDP-N-acetylglucosamine-1-phosphate transferase
VTSIVCFLAGAAAALLLWPLLAGVFRSEVLQRENYRGHRLPVATGLVIVFATLVVAVVQVLLLRLEVVDGPTQEVAVRSLRQACLLAFGLGLLGFVDDVADDTTSRGYRGHLRELAHGRLTTGGLKLIGTPIVAIMALNGFGVDGGGDLLLGAIIVALAANVGNLLDRAPGRTIKATALAGVVIALVVTLDAAYAGPAAIVGAGLGMLLPDMREWGMLGDTGANVLGGAIGFALAMERGLWERLVILVVLLALNAAAEFVSFSKVIDRTPPLRWVDRLGRSMH